MRGGVMSAESKSSTKAKKVVLSYTGSLLKAGPLGLSASGRPQDWR